MAWLNIIVNFLSNVAEPLIRYWIAQREKQEARKETQRHADTPVTPGDAASRLRKRARRKRQAANKR